MAQAARALNGGRILAAWRLSPELPKRLVLTVLAVLICYQFHWTWLRFMTSEASLVFAQWRGFMVERLSPDLIAWGGHRFEFGIACTFADVFCGAIPMLWIWQAGVRRNVAFIAAFAVGLFACNILRNLGTDLVFSAGVPWTVADNLIGALSYFAVWVFLVRHLERNGIKAAWTAATPSAVAP